MSATEALDAEELANGGWSPARSPCWRAPTRQVSLRLERVEACLVHPLAVAFDAATARCAQTMWLRAAEHHGYLAARLRSPEPGAGHVA
jgi:hypothetical protein